MPLISFAFLSSARTEASTSFEEWWLGKPSGHLSAEMEFPEAPEIARDLALKVIPHDGAALQWSLSGGGLTDSPAAELETLFNEAVARHHDSVDDARRSDDAVYRQIFSQDFESPVVKPHMHAHEVTAPLASQVFP